MKRVLILHDDTKQTRELILDEMMAENFGHEFKFSCDVPDGEFMKYLEEANEFWIFGEVKNTTRFAIAVDMGADIWEMG